ncbi:MAG: response regulator [Cytophagales bacterium]|nr:MAG: response regulator [Cytophagales bacterium]
MISTSSPKNNILFVDDEINNLISFKAAFRQKYNVFTAQGGNEALDIMKSNKILIIICDQKMPVMTGVELLEQVLNLYPDTIRMVLTAYSDINTIIEAINKGKIYRYISKPWNEEELILIIDHAIESYFLKEENRKLIEDKARLQLLFERQQKENIISQLESLKNQMNPHFLFNSLNTLSALIHEDIQSAERFIIQLTNVYRYVLDQSERSLVRLSDELTFMRSFFYLQKIRFGENIYLNERQTDENISNYYIPPLALQLLLENAIKHNVISKEIPLYIDVSVDEQLYLTVRNNYQKKEGNSSTPGLGIKNLKERYGLITSKLPEFTIVNNSFIAKIPLLSSF